MVIVLMRYNANPYILDSEGLNCLHVAAQLGFLDITAYYAAKGMVSGCGTDGEWAWHWRVGVEMMVSGCGNDVVM